MVVDRPGDGDLSVVALNLGVSNDGDDGASREYLVLWGGAACIVAAALV